MASSVTEDGGYALRDVEKVKKEGVWERLGWLSVWPETARWRPGSEQRRDGVSGKPIYQIKAKKKIK